MISAEATAAPSPLTIADLTVAYSAATGTYEALRHFSLDVRAGEFVAIVGPSGCGKSTLLSAIMGQAPVTAGTILQGGHAAIGPSRGRATVFQDARLLPWRTVLGNIMLGLDAQKVPKTEARRRAECEIERVGLRGFADFYPGQLSGGMQQRVNLARALAVGPSLLMLDEPFAALDAQTRERMQYELIGIWESSRVTTLFVTHQIDEALFLADRVVVIGGKPGRVVEEINVPFGRPRNLQLKRTDTFHHAEDRIWKLIADLDQSAARQ